jgi:hypothetical protein
MAERKTRVWLVSFAIGCGTSLILTAGMKTSIGFWFPPFWPGLFLALAFSIVGHGQSWDSGFSLILIAAGNAAFYSWLFLRVLRAEIHARGHISRYFLR